MDAVVGRLAENLVTEMSGYDLRINEAARALASGWSDIDALRRNLDLAKADGDMAFRVRMHCVRRAGRAGDGSYLHASGAGVHET
jgi:hypothetical protein